MHVRRNPEHGVERVPVQLNNTLPVEIVRHDYNKMFCLVGHCHRIFLSERTDLIIVCLKASFKSFVKRFGCFFAECSGLNKFPVEESNGARMFGGP